MAFKVFTMQEPLSQAVRMWGMSCHLASLGGILLVFLLPIPFLNVLVTYLVWRMGREKHPFVDEQGKEALNFQFSMVIYFFTFFLLSLFLLALTCGIALTASTFSSTVSQMFSILGIVCLLIFAIALIFEIVVILFAAIKAANGQSYRYPFTLRFVR
jgi:uncharacterized protein